MCWGWRVSNERLQREMIWKGIVKNGKGTWEVFPGFMNYIPFTVSQTMFLVLLAIWTCWFEYDCPWGLHLPVFLNIQIKIAWLYLVIHKFIWQNNLKDYSDYSDYYLVKMLGSFFCQRGGECLLAFSCRVSNPWHAAQNGYECSPTQNVNLLKTFFLLISFHQCLCT